MILTDIGREYAAEVIAAFASWMRRPACRDSGRDHRPDDPFDAEHRHAMADEAAAVRRAHPEIDLRLQSSVNQIDLGQGIVDIDIRYNPGPPPPALSWSRSPMT